MHSDLMNFITKDAVLGTLHHNESYMRRTTVLLYIFTPSCEVSTKPLHTAPFLL